MEPQWTAVFEELSRNVQSALRSDSHDYVRAVLNHLEANKSSILAFLDSKAPNAAHRAQLKLGTLFSIKFYLTSMLIIVTKGRIDHKEANSMRPPYFCCV